MVITGTLGLSITTFTDNCTILKTQLITALLFCTSHKPLQNQVWHLTDIPSFTEDKATAVVLSYAMQFNVFLFKIDLLELMYRLSGFLGLYFKAFSILIWLFMKNYSTLRTETFPMFSNLIAKLKAQIVFSITQLYWFVLLQNPSLSFWVYYRAVIFLYIETEHARTSVLVMT